MLKRMISAILCIAMLVSTIPAQCFATETTAVVETTVPAQQESQPVTEPTEPPAVPETIPEESSLPAAEEATEATAEETYVSEMTVTEEPALQELPALTGSCGVSATWSLDENGVLTIDGTGTINSKAFLKKTNITHVVIEDGITAIGASAFDGCSSMTSIELPDSLQIICDSAFARTGLTSLTLPEGLVTIEQCILQGNTGVKELVVPASVTVFANPQGANYGGLQGSAVEKVIFSEGMTEIPRRAAKDAGMLKEVYLPSTVKTIGVNAFEGCWSLTDITLPEGLQTIRDAAFKNTGLTSLTLPEGLITIEQCILMGNTGVKELVVPASVTVFANPQGANYGGLQGSAVEKVIFSEGMTEIPRRAAKDAGMLKEVYLPSTVKTIGVNAFEGCWSLTDITLPEGLQTICDAAFKNTGLTSLTLPEGLITIEQCILMGNTGVKELVVPASVTVFANPQGANYGGLQGSAVEKVVFSEGMTEIPRRAAKDAGKLKEVYLPSTLKTIGVNAFEGCWSLTDITLPEGLQTIRDAAFKNTGLTSLILPESLVTIEQCILTGNTGVKELVVPASVTTFGNNNANYGGLQGSSVEKVVFSEGMTEIPVRAAKGAEKLKEVILPATTKNIKANAFNGCKALTSIALPESLKIIGSDAFANSGLTALVLPEGLVTIEQGFLNGNTGVTELVIPSTVTTLGNRNANYGGLQGSGVKKVTFAEGTREIPVRAALRATNLEEVILPTTIQTIEAHAFNGCTSLNRINIPDSVHSIQTSAFQNCPYLVFYGNAASYGCVYAVENGLMFRAHGNFVDSPNYVLQRDGSDYYCNAKTVAANGYMPMTVHYQIKDHWRNGVTDMTLKVVLPSNVTLEEETLQLDGVLCSDYTFDGNRHLTVPVTADSGTLRFCIDVKNQTRIYSYAALSCKKDGTSTSEVIQILDESINVLTLLAPDTITEKNFSVEGTAPAGAEVTLYVDGTQAANVKASLAGNWSADLSVPVAEDYREYKVSAQSSGLSQSVKVTYHSGEPVLSGFVMHYNCHDEILDCDLMNAGNVKPKIYYLPKTQFDFSVTFENPDEIESVYVVSTRNNVKKYLEAKYNSATGAFETDGFFDENDVNYVPGTLHVEYNKGIDQVQVADHYDWSIFDAASSLLKDDVTVLEATDTDSVTQIDLSDLGSEFAGVFADAAISIYDEETDGDLDQWLGVFEDLDTLASYTIPGHNGEKYIAALDYSDPYTYVMLVKDVTGSKFIKLSLSLAADDPANLKKAGNIAEISSKLSNVNTIASILLKQHEIRKDMDELREEVWQTSYATPEQRQEALRLVDNLESDQSFFYLFTTAIPVIMAASLPALGATMTVAPIMFTALLGMITVIGPVFFTLRTNNIKSGKFRADFVIDPSGYVYDAVTQARIEGVKATAYCIRYDDSDTFWDTVPAETEYGTPWNAGEYDQMNPLFTNADGKYAWDVPEGWWRVKFEKEGYETVWSEWLPVPPPQMDVNIAMKRIKGTIETDFTGDGKTDENDAVYLLWHTLFEDLYPVSSSGDINGDNLVNDNDALDLLWFALFPNKYPL